MHPSRVSGGSDVLVLGAGAIGLSIAWRLARRGVGVTVVDEDPGRGASWAAAGLLAPVTEVHYGEEALLALNVESARRYGSFAGELHDASGVDPGYRKTGTLVVARDRDDVDAIDDLVAFQQKLGLEVERLSARDVRVLEPGLSPRTRGGIHVPDDHQIDNRALIASLLEACERSDVRFLAGEARAVTVQGMSATSVELTNGDRIDAGAIVVAMGARSGTLQGLPPELIRVRPVKGQLLHLDGESDLFVRNLRGLDVYLLARGDGRYVAGATVEEQGFDTRVTARAVYELLRDSYELVPGIVELELGEVAVGFRPGTPDNGPLLGPSGIDGLVLATGHYRNGILLTPVTADAIASYVLDGTLDESIAPFDPRRFDRQ